VSTRARIGVLAAIVVLGAAAFVLLSSGDDKESPPTPAPAITATTPAVRVVRAQVAVKTSGPVGGVKTVKAFSGDRVIITVKSIDYSGEVHLHGFDIAKEVAPGQALVYDLSPKQTRDPKVQGVVEMELEASSTQILKLEIQPS
jgi:hypothetical protein